MCPLLHRCAWWSAPSADVHAYSAELMPIMPTQGRMTIQPFVRGRVPGPAGAHRRPAPFRSAHEPPPKRPATRAHRYFAPSTATGFSVVYG